MAIGGLPEDSTKAALTSRFPVSWSTSLGLWRSQGRLHRSVTSSLGLMDIQSKAQGERPEEGATESPHRSVCYVHRLLVPRKFCEHCELRVQSLQKLWPRVSGEAGASLQYGSRGVPLHRTSRTFGTFVDRGPPGFHKERKAQLSASWRRPSRRFTRLKPLWLTTPLPTSILRWWKHYSDCSRTE